MAIYLKYMKPIISLDTSQQLRKFIAKNGQNNLQRLFVIKWCSSVKMIFLQLSLVSDLRFAHVLPFAINYLSWHLWPTIINHQIIAFIKRFKSTKKRLKCSTSDRSYPIKTHSRHYNIFSKLHSIMAYLHHKNSVLDYNIELKNKYILVTMIERNDMNQNVMLCFQHWGHSEL